MKLSWDTVLNLVLNPEEVSSVEIEETEKPLEFLVSGFNCNSYVVKILFNSETEEAIFLT